MEEKKETTPIDELRKGRDRGTRRQETVRAKTILSEDSLDARRV